MNTAVLTPSSPQLHARCALAVLAAALLASAMGLIAWGPVPLGAHLGGAGVPGAAAQAARPWAVAWHAPTLVAIGLGWRASLAVPSGAWRQAWLTFFAVAALAALTAAVEQVAPGTLGPVLVRVPAASACATVSLLFVAERLGRRWVSRRALVAALLTGPAAGLLCGLAQLTTGMADVRGLLWLEALPLVMVPLGIWGLQSRGLGGFDWLVALALLCVSKAMNWLPLADLPGPTEHGAIQIVHHLALAAAVVWLARALGRRPGQQALQPGGAEAGSASQRSTSRRTSSR